MDSNYNNNQNYTVNSQESDLYYSYSGNGFGPEQSAFHSVEAVPAYDIISKSFIFMFVALLITAFAATTTSPLTAFNLVSNGGFTGLLLLELALVFGGNFVISKNKPIIAAVLYIIYSYLTGVVFSVIFTLYTMTSVTSVFLITASVFFIMAVYGLVTKSDLSSWKTALAMGLIGILISSVVNIFFLHSDSFDTLICCVGVVIFALLIAFDTKKMKERIKVSTPETELSVSLYCAFELYLDFINIFLRLLRLMGTKRD